MKKIIWILIIVAIGIVIIRLGNSRNIDPQPAQVSKTTPSVTTTTVAPEASTDRRKREGFYCTVNGDGTITYGTATYVGGIMIFGGIFGHWEYGIGNTIPGGANACAGFLDGVVTP